MRFADSTAILIDLAFIRLRVPRRCYQYSTIRVLSVGILALSPRGQLICLMPGVHRSIRDATILLVHARQPLKRGAYLPTTTCCGVTARQSRFGAPRCHLAVMLCREAKPGHDNKALVHQHPGVCFSHITDSPQHNPTNFDPCTYHRIRFVRASPTYVRPRTHFR